MEDTTVNSMETLMQLKEKIAGYHTVLSELDNLTTREEFNQLNEKALHIEQFIATLYEKQNDNIKLYAQEFSTLSTQLQQLQQIADELTRQLTELTEAMPPKKQQPITEQPVSNDLSSFKQLQKILGRPLQLEPVNRQDIDQPTTFTRNSSFQNTQSTISPHRRAMNSAKNLNEPSPHRKYAIKLNTTTISEPTATHEPTNLPVIEPPPAQTIQVSLKEETAQQSFTEAPITQKQPIEIPLRTPDSPPKDKESLSLLNLFRKK